MYNSDKAEDLPILDTAKAEAILERTLKVNGYPPASFKEAVMRAAKRKQTVGSKTEQGVPEP